MISINYHHLYYFWTTAKAGSVTKAAGQLLLAQPTLSLQIRQLEKSFGKKLLERHRDGVRLTPDGAIAFEYCERIFSQGQALASALRQGSAEPVPVRIGVSSALSRETAHRVLTVVGERRPAVPMTVFSGSLQELQERLSRHVIDIAVCDADLSPALGAPFSGKLAGRLPVVFVALPRVKKALRGFPRCPAVVPMLTRTPENAIRKAVDDYLRRHGTRYKIVAETDDADLLRILAHEGLGVAAINAVNAEPDLKSGRLALLGPASTGIVRHVWLIAGRHPHPDANVRATVSFLMDGFAIRN